MLGLLLLVCPEVPMIFLQSAIPGQVTALLTPKQHQIPSQQKPWKTRDGLTCAVTCSEFVTIARTNTALPLPITATCHSQNCLIISLVSWWTKNGTWRDFWKHLERIATLSDWRDNGAGSTQPVCVIRRKSMQISIQPIILHGLVALVISWRPVDRMTSPSVLAWRVATMATDVPKSVQWHRTCITHACLATARLTRHRFCTSFRRRSSFL